MSSRRSASYYLKKSVLVNIASFFATIILIFAYVSIKKDPESAEYIIDPLYLLIIAAAVFVISVIVSIVLFILMRKNGEKFLDLSPLKALKENPNDMNAVNKLVNVLGLEGNEEVEIAKASYEKKVEMETKEKDRMDTVVQRSQIKFCPFCGKQIEEENAKFCPNCGGELNENN